MAIYSEWLNQTRNIILVEHDRDWNWDEMVEHDAGDLSDLLAVSNGPAALVVDLRRSRWLPQEEYDDDNFTDYIQASVALRKRYLVDIVVFVTREPEIGSILTLGYRKYADKACKFFYEGSVDAACAIIIEHRGLGEYDRQ